jgi:hypothetical protein
MTTPRDWDFSFLLTAGERVLLLENRRVGHDGEIATEVSAVTTTVTSATMTVVMGATSDLPRRRSLNSAQANAATSDTAREARPSWRSVSLTSGRKYRPNTTASSTMKASA